MIIYYDQIDSTNRIAKELALEGNSSGTVVRAGMQSTGKGQYGRTFSSPIGGLYFSLLLQPILNQEHLPLVTLATGLACREVLSSMFNLQSQIKWPNDIYLDAKKIAGILCENVIVSNSENAISTVVIGVGLNVNNTIDDFPLELQSCVTTLFEQLHVKVELDALFSALVTAIKEKVFILSKDRHALLAQWQRYDYLANKAVIYTAGSRTVQGTGLGISPEGYYRIREYSGVEHCLVGGQLRAQS